MPVASYRFLEAELQPEQRVLRVAGQDCQVGARAFDLLLVLVERRDRVVAKSELLDLVWPTVVVEENNLQVHISSLRKLLGAQAIATVPGRGYRFVAPLHDKAPPAGHEAGVVSRPEADAPVRPSKTNLPAHPPALLGRDNEAALLGGLLDAHRLVTVVGAGGIGKSRLAQAVAGAELERWREGVWWIELAGLADAALLVPNAARRSQLGLEHHRSSDAPQQALVDAVSAPVGRCCSCSTTASTCSSRSPRSSMRMLQAAPARLRLRAGHEPGTPAPAAAVPARAEAVPRDAVRAGASRGYGGALALFESRVRAARAAPSTRRGRKAAVGHRRCRRQPGGLPLAIESWPRRVPLVGLRACPPARTLPAAYCRHAHRDARRSGRCGARWIGATRC